MIRKVERLLQEINDTLEDTANSLNPSRHRNFIGLDGTIGELISAAHAEGVVEGAEQTGIVLVPLTRGQVAIIDSADAERVLKHKWCVQRPDGHGSFYVGGWAGGKNIRMHRFILDVPDDMIVDHINHNPLDNRRCNIRICTKAQNAMGQRRHGTSAYKGITFDKGKNRWRTRIWIDGKNIHLGDFTDEESAARAYNEAAKKYFGEYSLLNSVLAPTKESEK